MGEIKAEAPTIATTLRRGRRAHTGPDWKQMGPPCQVPDTPGGVGGKAGEEREKEGQPHAGSQSRPALRPRAGLKTPERQGRRRPSRSRELGEAVEEGQRP